MSRSLFRETSLERLSTPEQLDQVMRVTAPMAWVAIIALAAVVVGGLLWSILGTVPIKVKGKGILISPGGVMDVVTGAQGRVTIFKVQPGDRIEVGQVVAHLAQPDIQVELDASRAELTETIDHHRLISDFNKRDIAFQHDVADKKRAALRQKTGFLDDRLRWLREREGYQQELQEKGLIDKKRVIDTKIEINTSRDDMATTNNLLKQIDLDEATLAVEHERESLDLELKIGVLTRKVRGLEEKLDRNSKVVSPYAGHIVEFKVNAGEVIDPGRALFTVMPHLGDGRGGPELQEAGELVAKLYVPAEDGKKVRPGMESQIAPSTIKREEYGFIMGKVRSVAAVPASEEGMMRVLKNKTLVTELADGAAPIEVTVELQRDPEAPSGFKWSSSRGPNAEVNSGTLCEGTLTVREVRLITLVIPALEQLFAKQPLVP